MKLTLSHEHGYLDLSHVKGDLDTKYDDCQSVVSEYKYLKEMGVVSIFEVTNLGMGRDIDYIGKLEEESGIELICSTGFYKEPFLPKYVYDMSVDELASIMINEIKVGIIGNSIIKKAKFIGEIGTNKDEITPIERKVFEAAAIAAVQTGAPIITHTTLGTQCLEQVELLTSKGVKPNQIMISHVDLGDDLEQIIQLAKSGVYLSFDTVGKTNYQSEETRVKYVLKLKELGYLNQVLCSMDITRKSNLSNNGGIGYKYLFEVFIPMLKAAGFSTADLEMIFTTNPYNFKEGVV